jgi:hypothetical protein
MLGLVLSTESVGSLNHRRASKLISSLALKDVEGILQEMKSSKYVPINLHLSY